jgi:hypothetical protein
MKTYARKGSLSLSVNAIVVLVLAITMLGLGIAFTKNMFINLGEDLIKKTKYENIPEPMSSDPVSFENTRIYAKQNKLSAAGFKAMNTLLNAADFKINTTNCLSSDGYEADDIICYNVQPGEIVEYAMLIKSSKPSGDIDICPLVFIFDDNNGNTTRVSKTLQIIIE